MKWLIPCFIFLFIFIPSAFGAGTITQTGPTRITSDVSVITLTCTADSSDATFPAKNLTPIYGWILRIVTDPGTTAPTANYDITLVDTRDCDVTGGTLANRSATASEQIKPCVFVDGVLTANITGNEVNSAEIIIKIYALE